jgi:hypothetical protein
LFRIAVLSRCSPACKARPWFLDHCTGVFVSVKNEHNPRCRIHRGKPLLFDSVCEERIDDETIAFAATEEDEASGISSRERKMMI